MRCSSRSNSTAFSEKAGERRKRMEGWIQIKKKKKKRVKGRERANAVLHQQEMPRSRHKKMAAQLLLHRRTKIKINHLKFNFGE